MAWPWVWVPPTISTWGRGRSPAPRSFGIRPVRGDSPHPDTGLRGHGGSCRSPVNQPSGAGEGLATFLPLLLQSHAGGGRWGPALGDPLRGGLQAPVAGQALGREPPGLTEERGLHCRTRTSGGQRDPWAKVYEASILRVSCSMQDAPPRPLTVSLLKASSFASGYF